MRMKKNFEIARRSSSLSCHRRNGSNSYYSCSPMAKSSRASTWCIVRCFSCCFNLLATDSGSNPGSLCTSSCSERTSCSNASTSLIKSALRRTSSSSSGGRIGPWCWKHTSSFYIIKETKVDNNKGIQSNRHMKTSHLQSRNWESQIMTFMKTIFGNKQELCDM